MEKLRAYWKSITAIVASIAAAVGVIWGGGDLALQADDWVEEASASHVLAQTNQEVIGQILEYQKRDIERERAREAEAKRKRAFITELCLTGKTCDRDLCASVGLEPKCDGRAAPGS